MPMVLPVKSGNIEMAAVVAAIDGFHNYNSLIWRQSRRLAIAERRA